MSHFTISLQMSWELIVVSKRETAAKVDVNVIVTYYTI